jgi:hypothetical protein
LGIATEGTARSLATSGATSELRDVEALLDPRSIAIVGASVRPDS